MDAIFKCTLCLLIIIISPCLSQKQDALSKPTWIDLTQFDGTSAVLQWSSHARVKSYEILYYPSGVPSQVKRMTMASRNNGKQGVRFTNLSPNTRYVAKLRAISVAGDLGPWISRNLTIFRYGHLVINVKPTDQKVFEGSTIILPCEASGFPTPNITWFFRGRPIRVEHSMEKTSLVLNNVKHGRHDGRYTCVATSKAGTVSTSATLLIDEIPPAPVLINITQVSRTSAVMQWSSPHQNNARTRVKSYEILYYPSGVPSQVKRMIMASRKNGKRGVRFTNLSPNTRYVAKLRAISVAGDLGPWISRNFTTLPNADPVININPDDQRKQEASDVIFVRPVINFKPTDQTVFEGSTILLPCEATGFPKPKITWLLNDDPIPWDHSIENGYLIINNVRHGRHDGRYTCVASSKAGTVSTPATLLIYVQVAAAAPFREYTFSLTSQRANLSCYGHGYPSPNVTWTKNGLPVSLAQKDRVINKTLIESRLNLESLTIDKAGRYTCKVGNGVYGQKPSSVSIDVFLRPLINVKPTDQTVFEGSTIILPCEATGFPTPKITWLFNDDPIPLDHSIENGYLVLNNVRHGRHDDRYTCVATSKAGSVSSSASVLVYVQIAALAPSREYIFSNTSQNAKLICYGRGYPLLNVTWAKNGLPVSLTQTDRVVNETFIESRLNLGNLTFDKAGRYTCEVDNRVYGQKPSSVAIDVFVRPVINVKPTDQTVFEGSTIILPCEASGFPTPNITWLFNGDPIPWDHSIEKNYLVLNNVKHGRHDGRYTCVATSKAGTVSTSVSLLVFVKVTALVQTTEYIFSLTSQRANISCYGRGYPLPNITWTKNGLPVSLTQTDRVINEAFIGSRLNLGNLTIDKAGRYSCIVSNGVDGQKAMSVAIETLIRPVINVKPTDQKVFEASTIILPCEASGFPTPSIAWLFNDDPIPWDYSIENGSLVINNVRHGRHDGRYTCVATNKAGTVSTSASVLIYVKLSALAPVSEYIFSLTSLRANLSCYGGGYPLPNITWTKDGLPVSLNQTDRVINETFIESRLDLSDIAYDRAERYSCIVANGLQEPISVAIKALIRPVINVKPTDQKEFEGSTIIFPCEASGFPTPNITWLFNDDPIPWDHSIENGSLVINNVKHGKHDGRYTCVATSKAGIVSTSATLLIYVKVTALAPTREYIFYVTSQRANITCYGRGYPLPNITWTKDGLPVSLNQGDRVINDTFIESRLNLGNFTIEKAGQYFCHVGNGFNGQETISFAQEVLLYPVINVRATDKKALGESTVNLPCEASGFPKPNIAWLFNGDPIPWEHSIENGSLVLNNVERGRHDGRYTCVATSKAGKVSTAASLLVYDRPSSFAKKRKFVFSVIANEYVFLTCYGSGNPRPVVVWEKDGSPVSLNQTDIVINDTVVESRLHLGNFTREKAGTYHCYVKTRLDGVYIPVPGRLAIRALFYPAIITEQVEQDSIEGSTVVFECKTKGFPQPTTTWLFNEKPIPFEHTIDDEGSIVLENVRHNPHAGKYTCVATSEAGTARHFAWLFIDGGCPSNWETYRGSSSCYRIVTTRTAKWDHALRSCISMGGYLVKISSEEENLFVTNLAFKATSADLMWIGLSRIKNVNFRWTDGTSLSGRYSKWNKGEPNNASGNENCGHLYVRGSRAPYWNDHLCNYPGEKPFYACEKERI